MREKFWIILMGCVLAITACGKQAPSQPSAESAPTASPAASRARIEACGLLKREEIQAIQGSPITDEKSTEQADQEFRASQCYYTAEEANRSVSLTVTQSSAVARGEQILADYWKRMFVEAAEEKEEKRVPPKKIENLGDDAYWVGTRVGGTLYVLKKGAFIRLSLGGPDSQETKLEKTKKLAEKALGRL